MLHGVSAMRLAHLYDGTKPNDTPIEMYTENNFDFQNNYDLVSAAKIKRIIKFNACRTVEKKDAGMKNPMYRTHILGLTSFINHYRRANVEIVPFGLASKGIDIVSVKTIREIQKGE